MIEALSELLGDFLSEQIGVELWSAFARYPSKGAVEVQI
jgi:hypothetical protein